MENADSCCKQALSKGACTWVVARKEQGQRGAQPAACIVVDMHSRQYSTALTGPEMDCAHATETQCSRSSGADLPLMVLLALHR